MVVHEAVRVTKKQNGSGIRKGVRKSKRGN
jgi:hypothetical protein